MRTVALVNLKGGVGKTTLASNLASALHRADQRVVLIDTDPQGSLSQWRARGKMDGIPGPDALFLDTLDFVDRKASLTSRFDTVVVDTAPNMNPEARELYRHCDLVLVPVTAGAFELDALAPTLAAIKRSARPVRFLVVLNRVDNARFGAMARKHLEDRGYPVAATEIRSYIAFRDAAAIGGDVVDVEPKGNAAHDIRRLAQEVLALFPKKAKAS